MRTAIWLLPSLEQSRLLAQIIQELSRRFKKPGFPPHLTLLGPLQKVSLEPIESLFSKMTLPIRSIEMTDAYYRSFFLEFVPSEEILSLRETAEQAYGPSMFEDFRPHVSLLYGDLPQPEKLELIEELTPQLPESIEFSSMELWLTEGRPQEWRRLQ